MTHPVIAVQLHETVTFPKGMGVTATHDDDFCSLVDSLQEETQLALTVSLIDDVPNNDCSEQKVVGKSELNLTERDRGQINHNVQPH